MVAAGPTTSIREEPYQGDILKQFGVRGVIGKGGMADKTLAAQGPRGCLFACHRGVGPGLGPSAFFVRNAYMLEEFAHRR